MVDRDVNLPGKSGVVTAETTFALRRGLFGSEGSRQKAARRLRRFLQKDYTDTINTMF